MKAPLSMRLWFAVMAVMVWAGIYFSGFSIVSWLLYLPAAAFTIASIFGMCPSQLLFFKMFDAKKRQTKND
ncbi:MAG: hypothetical protein QM802_21280 [Agriterribacter sp.]